MKIFFCFDFFSLPMRKRNTPENTKKSTKKNTKESNTKESTTPPTPTLTPPKSTPPPSELSLLNTLAKLRMKTPNQEGCPGCTREEEKIAEQLAEVQSREEGGDISNISNRGTSNISNININSNSNTSGAKVSLIDPTVNPMINPVINSNPNSNSVVIPVRPDFMSQIDYEKLLIKKNAELIIQTNSLTPLLSVSSISFKFLNRVDPHALITELRKAKSHIKYSLSSLPTSRVLVACEENGIFSKSVMRLLQKRSDLFMGVLEFLTMRRTRKELAKNVKRLRRGGEKKPKRPANYDPTAFVNRFAHVIPRHLMPRFTDPTLPYDRMFDDIHPHEESETTEERAWASEYLTKVLRRSKYRHTSQQNQDHYNRIKQRNTGITGDNSTSDNISGDNSTNSTSDNIMRKMLSKKDNFNSGDDSCSDIFSFIHRCLPDFTQLYKLYLVRCNTMHYIPVNASYYVELMGTEMEKEEICNIVVDSLRFGGCYLTPGTWLDDILERINNDTCNNNKRDTSSVKNNIGPWGSMLCMRDGVVPTGDQYTNDTHPLYEDGHKLTHADYDPSIRDRILEREGHKGVKIQNPKMLSKIPKSREVTDDINATLKEELSYVDFTMDGVRYMMSMKEFNEQFKSKTK